MLMMMMMMMMMIMIDNDDDDDDVDDDGDDENDSGDDDDDPSCGDDRSGDDAPGDLILPGVLFSFPRLCSTCQRGFTDKLVRPSPISSVPVKINSPRPRNLLYGSKRVHVKLGARSFFGLLTAQE